MQLALVSLYCKDIISFLRLNLPGNLFLCAHCIYCDDTTANIQDFQQVRNSCDFVAFILNFSLSYHQLTLACPGVGQMDGFLPICLIMGSTHGFPIDCDNLPGRHIHNIPDPFHEAVLELFRIHPGEYFSEGIV